MDVKYKDNVLLFKDLLSMFWSLIPVASQRILTNCAHVFLTLSSDPLIITLIYFLYFIIVLPCSFFMPSLQYKSCDLDCV